MAQDAGGHHRHHHGGKFLGQHGTLRAMTATDLPSAAGAELPRRLLVAPQASGLWLPGRVRRILHLAGLSPCPALPGLRGDAVGVWGHSTLAPLGEALAKARNLPLVRLEDAFLRSILPGRAERRHDQWRGRVGPLGLMIDRSGGVHYDAARPSDLETLLARHPLDDAALLARARDGMGRLRAANLSKYNAHDVTLPAPAPGYVLIVDQTAGDAAIRHGGATWADFREMLFLSQEEHPRARIVIKTHPETVAGLRRGHFTAEDAQGRVSLCLEPIAPQALLDGAIAVYTVSSQLGFEAILHGHRPVVLGRPFYAGWGLSDDRKGPIPRRGRTLTRAQMFAAALILAPTWYDPCRDRLCSFEDALNQLEAEVHAFREDHMGHVAMGMRLWKRGPLQDVFGRHRPLIFQEAQDKAIAKARAEGRGILVWSSKDPGDWPEDLAVRRVEDGFLRSKGLGAELVPPLSLVTDDLGIYYDPTRENRLDQLIAQGPPPGGIARAEALLAALVARGVTKYNLSGPLPDLPQGHRILVPGQVEDDASVRLGGHGASISDVLARARAENPGAVLVFKPHPDVLAGLRPGLRHSDLADVTLGREDAAAAMAACDEVWTLTSGLGFEALLRGKPVTCLGNPFYAGWGLTRDLGPPVAHRRARPGLPDLVHSALIAYPRYHDPVSHLPCPPEVVMDRLSAGHTLPRAPALRSLAKLQGLFASKAHLWRRD
jgi:capsular polysaccharide export protein